MGRTARRVLVSALFFVLLSSVVAAMPCVAFALSASPVTRLTGLGDYRENFHSDGRTIVYNDMESDQQTFGRIGIFDLATRKETLISSNARNADVSGNTVVFDKDGGFAAYDIATHSMLTTVPLPGTEPKISGDIVVYGASEGVQGIDLSTGETFVVSTDPNAYAPDISNGWIVYCVLRPYTIFLPNFANAVQGDIMAYNIATKQTYTVCDDPHDQRNPHIGASGIVVWDDDRNEPDWISEGGHEQEDIYGCSVYDRVNFPVATDRGFQSEAFVDGDLVTYFDNSAPHGYSYWGLDLLSGTRVGLVPKAGSGILSGASLSGGMMVYGKSGWRHNGLWGTALYMMQPSLLDAIDGSDSYSNAAAASRASFSTGASSVIIASSASWTDDLAAAGYAGTHAPLLLTGREVLPEVTVTELRRLGATNATIIGGTGSVSTTVAAEIQSIMDENAGLIPQGVTRVAALSGSVARISGNRYTVADSTAVGIARRTGWNGTVFIVAGASSAAAMTVVPLASARGIPVLISGPKGLSSAEVSLLRSLRTKRAVLVGNSGAVPAKAAAQLASVVGSRNVRRLAGKDSYATAALVAAYGVDTLHLKWSGLGIASMGSLTDLLTAGLRKGRAHSVILLTSPKTLTASTSALLNKHARAIRRASYVGTTRLVSKSVRGQVRRILR